uniref:FAM192A/Fyv6 N-terminal domain-containing protein n=1 Tax=Biomphalaria glabrata TaxID=6526 RepID=A0A2C9KS96_BIOGL
MSGKFKAFVSDEEVQEQRQRRQEQWEKIRQPDDPLECPEEETRSLYEQLQANKELKEREHEEETKLRSSVKVLDEDEVQFLNYVSDRQVQIEKDRHKEEKSVIEELKMASVIKVQESKEKDKASSEPTKSVSVATSKNSQKQLLQGAIKRKSTDTKSELDEKNKKEMLKKPLKDRMLS